MLVITLFQNVPDNNSLKILLWHFVRHVGNVCCHYNHDSVYYNRIRLIKAHPSFFETAWIQPHSTSLGNWLSVRLRTKWFWVRVQLYSLHRPSQKKPSHVMFLIKEEMYNTMNCYYKYTSIPKSSFNKTNILILPINTGKK